MSDQTVKYAVGSWVWCEISYLNWWPGKVVDPSSVPDQIKEIIMKDDPVAVVFFKRQNSYECVTSADKICQYSCDEKLGFLERGYLLYEKQMKSGEVTELYSMANFVEDVLSVEKELGGKTNVFDRFKQQKAGIYQCLYEDCLCTFTSNNYEDIKRHVERQKNSALRNAVERPEPRNPRPGMGRRRRQL